jgi:hypothetical protein
MPCPDAVTFAANFQCPQALQWRIGKSGTLQHCSAGLTRRGDIAPGKCA